MNKINEWKKTESKEVNKILRDLYFKIKSEIEKNLEEAFKNNESFKFEFLLNDKQRKIMNENNHDELERFLENRIDRDFAPAVISEVYTTDDSKFVKVKEVKMYMIVNIHFYERYLNID